MTLKKDKNKTLLTKCVFFLIKNLFSLMLQKVWLYFAWLCKLLQLSPNRVNGNHQLDTCPRGPDDDRQPCYQELQSD